MRITATLVLSIIYISGLMAQADSSRPVIYHGEKGWHLESADGNFATDFQLRLQLRYSYPFEDDPVTLEDLQNNKQHIFKVRRARVKIGGHAFSPKLKYYFEYEVAASNLLDFWAVYSFRPAFKIRAGQYKARYNTERVISSGRQQTADRSILTRPFTIDRQIGLTLFGDLEGEGLLNFSYWAAVFGGLGRGLPSPDDDQVMWQFRGQWNMFGRKMSFVGSDLEKSTLWRGYLAAGAVTNQSQYTRFSQSGGGQLRGYPDPSQPGQYRIHQWFAETAFKKSGISWQQELHWKQIRDQVNGSIRTLMGNYIQLGSFPEVYIDGFPEQLEIASRYSIYIPDISNNGVLEHEWVLSLNWFFRGHNNKLTSEVAWIQMQDNLVINPGWRFRFQWDVSF